ncbi:hypothetical protein THAOC_06105 [Thalassiosira oceanica]|uniref:Uncharacterized protein n=1 Tax=Thalassiosira oceanica TaxID=159749 RepID=K0T3T5_THAOC|nr:hypothetical protein THAOC_06105 [Thalassiosira oceanica]|eukprot:EJK72370.1 hypothetical protein THAOC_06105 [Thalassiosira oceanica]
MSRRPQKVTEPIYQEGIENSMRRSSIPTSIPLFELDCDCDEVSVVTTETFGAEIVEATKKEFITRLKALTAARASGGKRVTKDECEELLYKIHAEQREKYVGGTSVEVDKSEEGDRSGAEAANAEAVAEDAEKSKEVKTRRRPRKEKSSLSESMRTVKSANKSRKKEARCDDRITWNGSKGQFGFTSKDEERASSDNDSRQEELSQLIELKLQLAKQQELIDSLNAKLSSMSKVQERNNDLERENDVLWKKVMALQSASKNQSRSVGDQALPQSTEQSASENQGRSPVVNKISRQSIDSNDTEETAPCSAASDIQSLYSELIESVAEC